MQLFARGVAPAIATGNCAVVKPADETPRTSVRLAELAVAAGIPDGAVNVVPGIGAGAGAALTAHPDIRQIGFVGSTAVGALVNTHLTTANRDETCWPRPHDIDFHRPDNPHTSFGVGVHRCLGTHLARLEMQLLFEEWHRRIPEYAIAEGTSHRARLVRANIGMESLRLTIPTA